MDNKNCIKQSFADGLRPRRKITVAQYAEQYVNNPNNTAEGGKYSIDRAPYQRAILDALTSGNGINEVVWIAGAQIGKTYVAVIWMGYIMFIDPNPIIVYQPTKELAESFSAQKLSPFFESNAYLKALLTHDKVSSKGYLGQTIELKGGNSGNSYRMLSSPNIFTDELDSFEDIKGEGDPTKLIEARATTYGARKKLFWTSTPTISGLSRIEKKFLQGDQNYYYVPCPHPNCGAKQKLIFENLKYKEVVDDEGRTTVIADSIHYECEVCNQPIKEHHKTKMLLGGFWIPKNPNAPKNIKSFQISALYSPLGMYSWYELILAYIDAKDDPFKLQVFTNVRLGETFSPKASQPSYKLLQERAENYFKGDVNRDGAILFGAIDVQEHRLEGLVMAIGRAGELWYVDRFVVPGSPTKQSTWNEIHKEMSKDYKHVLGFSMKVHSCFVDTGGRWQSDVYEFVRTHSGYTAIKGASHDMIEYVKKGNDIDKNPITGAVYKNPVALYLINTKALKTYIYTCLNEMLETEVTTGEKIFHFPHDFDAEFYKQLTAEKLIKSVRNGSIKEDWIKDYKRNEALDLTVYCLAQAFMHQVMNLSEAQHKNLLSALITSKNVPFPADFNSVIEKVVEKKEEVKKIATVKPVDRNDPMQRHRQNSNWINTNGWRI